MEGVRMNDGILCSRKTGQLRSLELAEKSGVKGFIANQGYMQ
jgi:hypothetical protein